MELTTGLRSAGVLMHISSLPSSFGIGDLGPDAYAFADFLHRSSQTYWQVLPVNPTTEAAGHSPYSAYSGMAGNPLLISPELLHQQSLVTDSELNEIKITNSAKVNFQAVWKNKTLLLKNAYDRFMKDPASDFTAFGLYSSKQAYWLDDFATYMVIREEQKNKPWYEWPQQLKKRDPSTLERFTADHAERIDRVRWEQMIFEQQWLALKAYCHSLHITIFGDMPLYVGHDSADIWGDPHLFSLDDEGHPIGVAGVPPDAFSATGQRWGMPVYNWEEHTKSGFSWWIRRLKKNLEYFDLLRIDHFRALAAYYDIPAAEETAIHGQWKPAPGKALFEAVREALCNLPFVAEDLGKIDQQVLDLRDAFGLPGMNVLQFAFGENMPRSNYIPHHHHTNSLTYTGTHDNPTTRGWYATLNHRVKRHLHLYTGRRITAKNVDEVLMRMAYSSVSKIAILPLQDILHLDDDSRMNDPSGKQESWTWRVDGRLLDESIEKMLEQWCTIYDRKPRTVKEREKE